MGFPYFQVGLRMKFYTIEEDVGRMVDCLVD